MHSPSHPRWHGSNNLFVQCVSPPLYNFWFIVNSFFRFGNCTVYKIYPQSETPHLTRIAHLDFDSTIMDPYLISEKVIWYGIYDNDDRIVFRVWNYLLPLNHSISFSVQVNVNFKNFIKVHSILSKALKLVLRHSFVGNRDRDRCDRPL